MSRRLKAVIQFSLANKDQRLAEVEIPVIGKQGFCFQHYADYRKPVQSGIADSVFIFLFLLFTTTYISPEFIFNNLKVNLSIKLDIKGNLTSCKYF